LASEYINIEKALTRLIILPRDFNPKKLLRGNGKPLTYTLRYRKV